MYTQTPVFTCYVIGEWTFWMQQFEDTGGYNVGCVFQIKTSLNLEYVKSKEDQVLFPAVIGGPKPVQSTQTTWQIPEANSRE